MLFFGPLCKPPCFSVASWNIHAQIWQFDAKHRPLYEFEFDFFNEIRFLQTINAHLDS